MTTPIQSLIRSSEPVQINSTNAQNKKINETFRTFLEKTTGQPAAGALRRALAGANPSEACFGPGGQADSAPAAALPSGLREALLDKQHVGDSGDQDFPDSTPETPKVESHAFLPWNPVALIAPAGSEELPVRAPGPMPFAELWCRLVRRVAWGGDRHRATARIEIGEGEWAGVAIVVHAVERQVSVVLELPPGARPAGWRERIAGRLRERGLELSELTVR